MEEKKREIYDSNGWTFLHVSPTGMTVLWFDFDVCRCENQRLSQRYSYNIFFLFLFSGLFICLLDHHGQCRACQSHKDDGDRHSKVMKIVAGGTTFSPRIDVGPTGSIVKTTGKIGDIGVAQ